MTYVLSVRASSAVRDCDGVWLSSASKHPGLSNDDHIYTTWAWSELLEGRASGSDQQPDRAQGFKFGNQSFEGPPSLGALV